MAVDLLQHSNVKQVIFIDKGVDDWQSLVDGAPQGADIVTLDPSRDGLVQMAEWAEGKAGYAAIHVLSHGSQGQVQLGTASLNNDTLSDYSAALAQIGQSLTVDGDILIYGCNVAAGCEGRQFISALTEVTELNVAAATHKVGHESLGGDWDLDHKTDVHTKHLRIDTWRGHLAAPSLINGLGGTAGFGENEFPRNDDGVTSEIDITSVFGEQGLKFGDTFYTGTYINNNGMITFGEGYRGFSPSGISNGVQTQSGYLPLISLFWTDIDTRGGVVTPTIDGTSTGSNLVYWDIDTDITDGDGKKITFTWDDVGLYNSGTTPALAGQIVLYDAGSGNMNIEFRYEYAGSSTAAAGWNVGVSSNTGGREGIDYYQISAPGD